MPALRLADAPLGLPLLPQLASLAGTSGAESLMPPGSGRASARLLGQLQIERFYPRRARQQGLGGRSVVDLDIDAGGKVVAQRLILSDPPGLFDEAALRLVAALRFEPAQADNRPVASRLRQTILWSPAP
jgi:TonB family protein